MREKTEAQNIVKEIKQYRKKWLQHVQRMDRKKGSPEHSIGNKTVPRKVATTRTEDGQEKRKPRT